VRDEEFAAFCRREHPKVLGALILFCGDRSVAEEVTSEAFARAWRDRRRIRRLDAPGAWVRRVAINLAASAYRRRQAERRARRRLEGRATSTSRDPDTAEAVAVREALQRMRADHRAVLVLRYLLDLSVEEVAATLERSPSAVTSLTQRAAAALREELGPGVDSGLGAASGSDVASASKADGGAEAARATDEWEVEHER
jgi:RNA polymerase sigma factor (sigma-70 family)